MHDEQTAAPETEAGAVMFRTDSSGFADRSFSPAPPSRALHRSPKSSAQNPQGALMPEDVTVVLAKEGNRDAFRRLYEENRERIFRTAFRYSGRREDAEDIMQETFIKAFSRIRTFDFRVSPNFSSWLLSICINTAIDSLRRRERRQDARHISLANLSAEIPACGPGPDETAAHRLAVVRIRETLRILSPRQRAMFDMRYTEHLDIKEIAGALGCSESNVKTQLSRALEKLRKTLDPEWRKP